jgi:hypothetical protein
MIDQLSSNGFALLGYIVSIGLMVGYALMLWLGHRAADRKARPRRD